MPFHLHILINSVPQQGTWVRSPEEKIFYQTNDSRFLAEEYVKRTDNLDHTIHVVENVEKSNLANILQREDVLVLNLCVGIELDGVAGPSVSSFLEKHKIPYVGPSFLFQTKTFDKTKMKDILQRNNVPTPKHILITSKSDPVTIKDLTFPVRLRPADTLLHVGKNGLDFVAFGYDDCLSALESLGKRFPLILVEEHSINARDIWFFVTSYKGIGTVVCRSSKDEDAENVALQAYQSFDGKGHALINVCFDYVGKSYLVKDVMTSNALLWVSRFFGQEQIFQYITDSLMDLSSQ